MGAIGNAGVFYSAAYLSYSVAETLNEKERWMVGVHAFIVIVAISVVWYIAKLVDQQYRKVEEEEERRRLVVLNAYQSCDAAYVAEAEGLEACGENLSSCLVNSWRASNDRIRKYVSAAFSVLANLYGQSSSSENRIDFEVTFMTKSLKDDKITIPASANRDVRKPRTMKLRDSNPDIYDQSVTAQVYRADSPRTIITSDTSNAEYAELYAGQKSRIQSAIVYPVLSPEHKLMGTLVAHCDRKEFFKVEEEKFWHDFFEIFSKRIALEMMRIETLHRLSASEKEIRCSLENEAPF